MGGQTRQRGALDLQREANNVIGLQSWSAFALRLAILVLIPTALLIAFFHNDEWQTTAIDWANEQEYHELATVIIEGRYESIDWTFPAGMGFVISGFFAYLWWSGSSRARARMRSIPGLRSAVKEERRRRREEAWAVAGCLLLVFFLFILMASGFEGGGERNDEEEEWERERERQREREREEEERRRTWYGDDW
jgi:hypothetical protein